MKNVVQIVCALVLGLLGLRAGVLHASETGISPVMGLVVSEGIMLCERPETGKWRWDPLQPDELMRSTDVVMDGHGECWFARVKGWASDDRVIRSTALLLTLPSKTIVLRDRCAALITDPKISLARGSWGLVAWREVVPFGAASKSDLFAVAVTETGQLLWGPKLIAERIGESAVTLDASGLTHVVACPGGPWTRKASILPPEHLYFTISRDGEEIEQRPLEKFAAWSVALTCDRGGQSYLSWMDGYTRYVASVEQDETKARDLGEIRKLPGILTGVLRAKAFINDEGDLVVDNLIWSNRERKWEVVRQEYTPENPVPGKPETTIFIDPEGGIHISTPGGGYSKGGPSSAEAGPEVTPSSSSQSGCGPAADEACAETPSSAEACECGGAASEADAASASETGGSCCEE